MNYQETLAFLYRQLPMYQRVGKTAYKKDLTNTYLLLERLDNPQHQFPSVHIAGTNGKGSSAHLLESILSAAGYRTGLYTSPHLKDFTERIRVSENDVTQGDVVAFVDQMKGAIEDIQPSFFELTVAMAFWYFAQENVDIAIVETGLGGRLDSTNVLNPIICLITMIGWDHAEILGDTLEKIAGEKAGIIKKGIPVVVGAHQPELLPVFEGKAASEGSPLWANRPNYRWDLRENDLASQRIDLFREGTPLYEGLLVNNGASYVLENLPGVLEVVRILADLGWVVSEDHVREGLRTFEIRGRWQILRREPMVVADVSHNASGLQLLFDQLASYQGAKHIVFGMVKEKDIAALLDVLPRDASYYWTQSSVPRSLPVDKLEAAASKLGLKGEKYPNVNAAMAEALSQADVRDSILVCGSTFVVAEIEGL